MKVRNIDINDLDIIDINAKSRQSLASVPRRFRFRGVYMGVGGEKGETSGMRF